MSQLRVYIPIYEYLEAPIKSRREDGRSSTEPGSSLHGDQRREGAGVENVI